MSTQVAEKPRLKDRAASSARSREHLFYFGMSIAIVATVFAGFAPTYYLRSFFGVPPLMPLLHLHGFVFTSWIAIFLVQTTLVTARRTEVHRRLGIAGGVIAMLVVIVGTITAITRAKQGAAPLDGPPPLVFMAIPLFDMLMFSILVGAGFYFRRRPDVHKRLMMLATLSILAAAIARLPFGILKAGPPAFFGLTDLFIVACVVYDLIALKRVHKATALGGLLLIVSQPLRLMLSGTALWMSFASWLTQ
jgi:hypothetical protein